MAYGVFPRSAALESLREHETTWAYLCGTRASRRISAIRFTTIAFVLLCNLSRCTNLVVRTVDKENR